MGTEVAMLQKTTTKARKKAFLEALSVCGSVTKAANDAGVDRVHMYKLRTADETFRDAWEDSLLSYGDKLIEEAHRRAVEGIEEPVFYNGQQVGVKRVYSDSLLVTLLKGFRSDKFRDRVSQEVTGPGGGPIEIRAIDYRAYLAPLAPPEEEIIDVTTE